MSPSYLLPARLPTSFPNLFGNKASVHSQGLAGQGGTGLGVGVGAAIWKVRGMGGQCSLWHHGSGTPHGSGLANLNLELAQIDLEAPREWG